MNNIEITDSDLDKRNSIFYRLSIQLALNGFSFCIVDTRNNKILELKNKSIPHDTIENFPIDYYCQYLYDFIINEPLFKLNFKAINVVYITKQSTLVPTPVYEKDGVNSIFLSNMKMVEEEIVLSNKIKLFDAYSVFSIPDCVKRVLSRQFVNFNILHQSDSLIQCAMKNSSDNSDVNLFLNINYSVIDILVTKSNKLLFYNSYAYKNDDDIVYYLVNVNEQLDSNNRVKQIILSGYINANNELLDKINAFFNEVSFVDINKHFNDLDNYKEIPLHNHFVLLNSGQCE